MQREEFLKLFEKQIQGTISPEEEIRLNAWFDEQQSKGLSTWDDELLGDKNEVEKEILVNINHEEKAPRIFRLNSPWLKLAASVFIISTLAVLWYKVKPQAPLQNTTVAYTQSAARYGQVIKVVLPDSSKVWLNAGSRLRYPQSFDGKTREIELEGEAFFDVKHNEHQPFIVHSGELNTQVLGTTFNIKAYKTNRKLRVTVATGKVAVYTKNTKAIFLTPNQTAVYDKDLQAFNTSNSPSKDVTAWTQGKLVYKNELLSQALQDVSNKYGIKVTASPNLKSCQIYGTFRHNNVEALLKMITYSVNGKLIKTESGYLIEGKGCK